MAPPPCRRWSSSRFSHGSNGPSAPPPRTKGLNLDIVAFDAWLTSNDVLLERILQNLVSNAIRYTEKGSVTVSCHASGEQVRIDVKDTGVGIAAAQIPLIFGEFYRVPEEERAKRWARSRTVHRRSASEILGHRLEVVSREGEGSTFSLLAAASAAPLHAHELSDTHDALAFGAGRRVLVIEDDSLALEALAGRLGAWGFDVLQAGSSEAAGCGGGRRNVFPIDLIITDYHPPSGSNGIDAVRDLKRTDSRLAAAPVIVMSGDTSGAAAEAAAQETMPFLRKPIMPMTLRTIVARALRQAVAAPATIN